MNKADDAKITALVKAGWKTEEIAEEMHMEGEAVDAAVSGHIEAGKNQDKKHEQKSEKTEDETSFILVTSEQLREIYEKAAVIGAKEALKTFERKEKQKAEEEDKVKKTKKMLSSYRRMKAVLSREAAFTPEEQIELRWKFIQDLMGNAKEAVSRSERVIQDREKRRQEDLYCIYRIEKAAEMYREECEKSRSDEAKRRYRELSMMYFGEKEYTVQEISQAEKVSDKTVYKDLMTACGIVSVYLFGI